MTRGVFNWNFEDVVEFLKVHKFRLNYVKGSHHYFIGVVSGIGRQVCVPFHGKNTIKPRTLKGIILQSGINKKDWLD